MTHDFTGELTANEAVALANAADGIDADGLFSRPLYEAMIARVAAHSPATWSMRQNGAGHANRSSGRIADDWACELGLIREGDRFVPVESLEDSGHED